MTYFFTGMALHGLKYDVERLLDVGAVLVAEDVEEVVEDALQNFRP